MELRQPWLACGSRSRLCRLATPRACNPQLVNEAWQRTGRRYASPWFLRAAGDTAYENIAKHSSTATRAGVFTTSSGRQPASKPPRQRTPVMARREPPSPFLSRMLARRRVSAATARNSVCTCDAISLSMRSSSTCGAHQEKRRPGRQPRRKPQKDHRTASTLLWPPSAVRTPCPCDWVRFYFLGQKDRTPPPARQAASKERARTGGTRERTTRQKRTLPRCSGDAVGNARNSDGSCRVFF
jgi:hypothetical protein